MADLVPPNEIEERVGARRHPHQHLGRAVSAEETVYVLHSQKCKDSGIDLRGCPWSLALDLGINPAHWESYEDRPVVLAFYERRLFPVTVPWLADYALDPASTGDGGGEG